MRRESVEDAYERGYSEGYAAAIRESRHAALIAQARKKSRARAETAYIIEDAKALLARIGPDPEAARHRHEVSQW